MMVLDTNVISELMRPAPSKTVLDWLRRQNTRDLFTTTVSEAEIFYGIETAPFGRRRQELLRQAEAILGDFENRVLPFDRLAARVYASVASARKSMGRPAKIMDTQIAAICLCNEALLVTRNVADFEGCGVRLVNPWDAA